VACNDESPELSARASSVGSQVPKTSPSRFVGSNFYKYLNGKGADPNVGAQIGEVGAGPIPYLDEIGGVWGKEVVQ